MRKTLIPIFTLGLSCILSLIIGGQIHAATYTVTNTNDSGAGSLRQAIISANGDSGLDSLTFTVGSGLIVIIPTSPLPAITSPLNLDATTQPGFSNKPIVELRGSGAGSNARGLYITNSGSGSTIRGLIINSYSAQGIFIDTSNVNIKGNYIGTNAAGTAPAPNLGGGIGIFSGTSLANANNNTIGGTTAADRNLISGNNENGIVVNAQNGGHTQNNLIVGNYVGTNIDGTSAIPNAADGILINDAGSGTASNNTVGGTTGTTPDGPCTGACNLVSGNGYNGIGVWHAGAPNNTIIGNFVGVTAAGSWVIRNANIGVEINESADNIVGGTTANSRNILSGNAGAGVFITGASSHGNQVLGNYIGVDSTGTYSLNNLIVGVGIGYSPGIQPAHHNTIGSSTGKTTGVCDGGCNIISGNAANGILLSSSEGNTIAANHIGVNKQNSAFVGNIGDGVGLVDSPNNMIGGDSVSDGNIINGNGDNGVILTGNSTGSRIGSNSIWANRGNGILLANGVSISILQNSITANNKLGIDIGQNHITYNDLNDEDSGVNNQQNFPEIYAVKTINGGSYISGTLNSRPNTSYRLEFFQSDGCNAGKPNNYGEGQNYLGNTTLTTDQYGNKVYTFTPPSPLTGNKYITATATRMIGSIPAETSEFSICRLVNTSRPAFTNGANWALKDDLTSGVSDKNFGYGFPAYLMMCAWDANQKGVKLPVVYTGGTWLMRASYTTGVADNTFAYGTRYDTPVCGDWDGDGVDTIGLYGGGHWALRNSNTPGVADISFNYGSSTTPVVGDWDGDGVTGIGVVSITDSLNWSLRNTPDSGPADYSFSYGGNSGRPITGDWDGSGNDTIGVVYGGRDWNLRNINNNGGAQVRFDFGSAGVTPITW